MVNDELIWERLARGTRSRSRLSYARIVKASMRIADREGLEAVSMRRVAEQLNAGTMSIYRYVATRDQLLDLLLDEAYGEIAVPARPSRDWRTDLRGLACQTRHVLKRHSWLGPLLTSRPTLGPHYLRWFEFALASTAATGLDVKARVRLIGTVNAWVAGVVGYELGEAETNRRHKLTEKRKRELVGPYLDRILETGRYPHLAEFVRVGSGEVTDADFEFGLDCVILGLWHKVTG